MECFKTVLKSIGFVIGVFGASAIFVGIIVVAAVATACMVGIGPDSPWVGVMIISYFIVGLGTTLGVIECHT